MARRSRRGQKKEGERQWSWLKAKMEDFALPLEGPLGLAAEQPFAVSVLSSWRRKQEGGGRTRPQRLNGRPSRAALPHHHHHLSPTSDMSTSTEAVSAKPPVKRSVLFPQLVARLP